MSYESTDSKKGLIELLRDDLVGELQAINQYIAHINAIKDEEVKEVLHHIALDEKEHVAELTKVIRKKDSEQDKKFEKEEL
jgi:rubrerythrin